jgi:hypothetical protein
VLAGRAGARSCRTAAAAGRCRHRGERIDIEFSDGPCALAEVSSRDAPAPSHGILRRRRRRDDSDTGQGSLFES